MGRVEEARFLLVRAEFFEEGGRTIAGIRKGEKVDKIAMR
jgi:hypothetical protein